MRDRAARTGRAAREHVWRPEISREEAPVLVAGAAIVASLAVGILAGDTAWSGWLREGLLLIAAVTAGAGIAVRAVRSLSRRDVSIDVLVTLAAAGALAIGELGEAAAVTFLFTLGHALEVRTLRRTRRAVGALLALLPSEVRVLRDGEEHAVAPHQVRVGEVVIVRAGERIPVDGVVTAGRAGVDEATLTGESMPKDKEPGAQVLSGTAAHGYLEIRVDAVGADTTLAQVVRRVEEAQEAKAPRQRFLERFARVYTPGVVVAAGLVWAIVGDAHMALTLLVIACPGALVIATPVATVAGIGRAAREGVLLKGGEALEQLARVRTVAFDKTGTLTVGRPIVREATDASGRAVAFAPDGSSHGPLGDDLRELLDLAARAEAGSEHPIALAVRSVAARHHPRTSARATEIEAVAGGGARARVDGRDVAVGSPAFLAADGAAWSLAADRALEALRAQGRTVAGVAVDGGFLGWIGLADELRPHAREALDALRAAGVRRMVMLTGDHPRTGAAVAAELGLDAVHAGLGPGDKGDLVAEASAHEGPVAMVGDGVNDAPALALADVGVAMGAAGTRVALETASVALMSDDLRALPGAVLLAQRTVRVVRQNLVVALATVAILVAGVLTGRVHMAGGMLVHQASVLLVILNALRLAGKTGPRRPAVPRAAAARRAAAGEGGSLG